MASENKYEKYEHLAAFHYVVQMLDRADKLEMSNEKLIAELGRIASALGVEPNMKNVLEEIERLKAATRPVEI